jgi:hypothetical protein
MAIKVRAINPGCYGHYRDIGSVFYIEDKSQFSKKWMEHADAQDEPSESSDDSAPAPAKSPKQPKAKKEKPQKDSEVI